METGRFTPDFEADKSKGGGAEKTNPELQKKQERLDDLKTVLSKVPEEARKNKGKYDEYKAGVDEAKKRLKESGIDTDIYTKKDLQIGTEAGNKEYGQRKAELRAIVEKISKGEELSEEELKKTKEINVKKEDLFVEEPKKEEEPEIVKVEETKKSPWEGQLAIIDRVADPKLQKEMRKDWLMKNLSNDSIPYSVIEAQLDIINQVLPAPVKENKQEQERLKEEENELEITRKRRAKLDVRTEEDLNKKMLEYRNITDPSAKSQMLRNLARHLYENGKTDWGNAVTEQLNFQMEKASTSSVEGLPKNQESATEWRKWIRAREASLLDPSVGEVKNVNEAFNVMAETNYLGKLDRRPVNGANYLKNKDLRAELLEGKKAADGTVEMKSELDASLEIGKLYGDWREAHKKLAFMVTAIEGGKYKLPDNNLNKRILNEIKSEDGSDSEGGSKNIAKATRIYWGMAHSNEAEGKEILRNEGLSSIIDKSIFNHQLTVEDIAQIRKEVADHCGGAYYENIGLMYASFYGVIAYGSDSTRPRIEYCDAMGYLVHTEINRFKDEKEQFGSVPRGYRYLDDSVANGFYEVNNGKAVFKDGEPTPIELGVHSGSLQEQVEVSKEPRAFYILRPKDSNEKYKIVKKLSIPDANGISYGVGSFVDENNKPKDGEFDRFRLNTDEYEEVLFDDLIRDGKLNEIDWGKSYDFSPIMVSREKGAVNVYKMFKNLDDDIAKLDVHNLIMKRETFEDALPQYGLETQKHTMFLWLYSLISKNKNAWTTGEKKEELKEMIDNAVEFKLITGDHKNKIYKEYQLSRLGDAGSLFDGKTYRPDNLVRSFFGKKLK